MTELFETVLSKLKEIANETNNDELMKDIESINDNSVSTAENDLSCLFKSLIDSEWSAYQEYETAKIVIEKIIEDNPELKEKYDLEEVMTLLTHIADEEVTHVGNLERCLQILNPEIIKKVSDGHEEAEDIIKNIDANDR